MTTSLRDLLTAVREGRLEPAEAAELLDTVNQTGSRQRASSRRRSDPGRGYVRHGASKRADRDRATAEPDGPDPTGEPERAEDAAGAADDPGATPAAWADAVDDPSARPTAAGAPPDVPLKQTRSGSAADIVSGDVESATTVSLRLRAMTRRVRVLAAPEVTTVSVDGPHELRREGATLILESDRDLPFGDPFAFLPAMRGGFRLAPPHGFPLSFGSDLVVRMNPAIALDVDVTAGSLLVRGLSRVRARVTAGSARIEEMDGPLDLHVIGGTAKVDMTARGRENRIRCESGSISLRLRKDSDVRLRPDAQLGRIVIDGAEGGREIAIGAGTGRLDVEIVMGNLQVEVER